MEQQKQTCASLKEQLDEQKENLIHLRLTSEKERKIHDAAKSETREQLTQVL